MPYLEYEGEIRALGPGVLTIGSGTEAGWRILGRDLTPLHAILTLERNGQVLVVRGSPMATLSINDKEIDGQRGMLSYGDALRLGTARFTYMQFHRQSVERAGYLHDTRRGRLYKLGDVNEIGRDVKCVVLIQEPEVSRVHAEVLRRESGDYQVKPVGSAYTLLNMNRLHEPHTLREGDELSIGRTVLRFTTEPAPHTVAATGGRHFAGDKRASKMQTTFMGSIDAREKIVRDERRKYGVIIVAVAFVIGSILLIVSRVL